MEDDKVKKFLEEKLSDLNKIIDEKDKRFDELMEKAITQANEHTEQEGKKISDFLKGEVEKEMKAREELQKQVDDISISLGKISEISSKKEKSFAHKLIDHFSKDEDFKRYQANKKGTYVYKLNQGFFGNVLEKADTMTPASNLSGQVTPVVRLEGVQYDPDRPNHVREIMNVIPIGTDTVYYFTETMDTNATQVTAPAADKGQSEVTITQSSETVTKISTYLRLAEEMLDDIPGMTAYLTVRFTKKLKVKEDQQILFGTGASNQLQGITPLAQAYDGDEISVSNISNIDVIRAAIAQARVDEYSPTYTILHPNDVRDIDLTKATDGQYVHGGIFGMRPMIGGVPILETTAMTEGYFLVGDFGLGATLWDRKQAQVAFSDQDQDNFIKNIITVRFEERLCQTVERPNAFIYGGFASALACGSAAS